MTKYNAVYYSQLECCSGYGGSDCLRKIIIIMLFITNFHWFGIGYTLCTYKIIIIIIG